MKALGEKGIKEEVLRFQTPVAFDPIKGKARTLAVSAIVKYENLTLLHASMLVDNTS